MWMMFRLGFQYLFVILLQGKLNSDITDLNMTFFVVSKGSLGFGEGVGFLVVLFCNFQVFIVLKLSFVL